MTRYAALLRGIGPSNPPMRSETLRGVFEALGFKNVRTVISSGNVLFEARFGSAKALEARIEKALPAQLGFKSTTIVRSKEALQKLADRNPFKGLKDAPRSRLNVTFLKNVPKTKLRFPYRAKDGLYKLVALYDRAVCSVIDLSGTRTPDVMAMLEKEFGKEITTRTWKTVDRILKKLDER